MSTLLERPKLRGKAGGPAIGGGLPQVNLLPPEVRSARGLRATKRVLGVSLVVALVAAVGVSGVAKVAEGSARNDLSRAQDDTLRLQREQSKYAELPRVKSALFAAQGVRQLAMSTDVQWKSYLDAIAAVLPANVSVTSYQVTLGGPAPAGAAPAAPGATPPAGTIKFNGSSLTMPDTAAWVDALNSVPGFANAWVSSATIAESADKRTYYTVSASVDVTSAAFSHRYDIPKAEG
jgi:Tfp pilus assembly protein PilN